jgi:DNA-binding transcriptional LysR family regulator
MSDGAKMARDIEVRHCRVLVAVHDHGGVGAAARALGMAQSTVSETLLSLERAVGIPVTARRAGREAVLTGAAHALLPHARTLISLSETARASAAEQGSATIRLGTVESVSSFLLPAPLTAFRKLWPKTDVRITIGLCEDLRRRVADGDLDAALTIESEPADVVSDLATTCLKLVTASRQVRQCNMVTADDLKRGTLLLSDAEGAFDKLMRVWANNIGCAPRIESAGSIEGVKRGVRAGNAIGVLPDYAVAEELSAGSLVELRPVAPLPHVALRLIARTSLISGSPLASLIKLVREHLSAA